jgi:hypothetical protein
VEKVYGRWVFGRPSPLKYMRPQDHAPSGWLFSRMLVVSGDRDTLPTSVLQQSRALLFHARAAWKKLGIGKEPLYSPLDFLEALTLSKNTMAAFSKPETGESARNLAFFPEAFAADEEEKEPAPLGLSGADLRFLDQELKVVKEQKKQEVRVRESRRLKPPPPPPLDDKTRVGLLGRFMLERYLELPPLSLEEVDGHIYMRATAMRALSGCPKAVQDYWKNRRWGYFRIFRLRSRPEVKHPWFEIALPGGYFALSGKAIELAGDEAELAFVLVRQFVRELRIKHHATRVDAKSWPKNLQEKSEEVWDQMLKAQSTRESENIDVADEIAVDMRAIECLARSGYNPEAGITYLKKLAMNRGQPWAEWFAKHAIGLDYRIERVSALTEEALAQQKIPRSKDTQAKRFAAAAKQWNILP